MKEFTECAFIAIIGLIGGFYLGRQSVKPPEEQIRYVKGDTIERTVAIEIPYQVEIPANPIFIYKTDTLQKVVIQKIDTAAILGDWITKRDYKHNLFDDSNGKLSIDASIQYNRLQVLKYNFTPLEKQITVTRKPVWTPFVEASYSTLNYVAVGGGLFYHDLGMSVKYVTDFDQKGFDIGLKYKF